MQIAEQKEAAIRGLSNYMFMEAQRMAKVSSTSLLLLRHCSQSTSTYSMHACMQQNGAKNVQVLLFHILSECLCRKDLVALQTSLKANSSYLQLV